MLVHSMRANYMTDDGKGPLLIDYKLMMRGL